MTNETNALPLNSGRERALRNSLATTDVQVMVFDGRRVRALGAPRDALDARAQTNARDERRAFMSARTNVVVASLARARTKPSADGDERIKRAIEKREARELRSEVEAFGVRGLSKWDRKALEEKRLRALGARVKKQVKTPRNIAIGMKRKDEEREESKRVEAHAAGYRLEKKAKKATSEGERDRGLAWGSSQFKNGVVKVTRQEIFHSMRDAKVDTKAMLRGAPQRKATVSGGKKTKKKKGKAVKAGKKSKRKS